jgi:hypothetical protein
MTRAQRRSLEKVAKSLVEVCVRNALEDVHAGIFPSSQSGDYSDVKVVTPYGEIPWTRLGRISACRRRDADEPQVRGRVWCHSRHRSEGR